MHKKPFRQVTASVADTKSLPTSSAPTTGRDTADSSDCTVPHTDVLYNTKSTLCYQKNTMDLLAPYYRA
jgi:hypothetical protein